MPESRLPASPGDLQGLARKGGRWTQRFLRDFRDFATKGNVVDMAVGVTIGTQFNAIVKSLNDNVLMPVAGYFMRVDISDLKQTFPDLLGGGPGVELKYGLFLQSLVNFVIIAFCMFLVIRGMMAVRRILDRTPEPAPEPAAPPPPTATEALLAEIRDLLKTGAVPGAKSADADAAPQH